METSHRRTKIELMPYLVWKTLPIFFVATTASQLLLPLALLVILVAIPTAALRRCLAVPRLFDHDMDVFFVSNMMVCLLADINISLLSLFQLMLDPDSVFLLPFGNRMKILALANFWTLLSFVNTVGFFVSFTKCSRNTVGHDKGREMKHTKTKNIVIPPCKNHVPPISTSSSAPLQTTPETVVIDSPCKDTGTAPSKGLQSLDEKLLESISEHLTGSFQYLGDSVTEEVLKTITDPSNFGLFRNLLEEYTISFASQIRALTKGLGDSLNVLSIKAEMEKLKKTLEEKDLELSASRSLIVTLERERDVAVQEVVRLGKTETAAQAAIIPEYQSSSLNLSGLFL